MLLIWQYFCHHHLQPSCLDHYIDLAKVWRWRHKHSRCNLSPNSRMQQFGWWNHTRVQGMLVLNHSVCKCFLPSWLRLVSVPLSAVQGTHFNASALYLVCSWTLLSSFEQLAQVQLRLHLNSEVLFSLGYQVQMLFQSSIHIIWFEFKVGLRTQSTGSTP